jgi:hypothetical protein
VGDAAREADRVSSLTVARRPPQAQDIGAPVHLRAPGHVLPGDPLPQGPLHIDVGMELWVPQQRTTVREMTAEAAGQKLVANINHGFGHMTLEPGAKPQRQTIALGPPEGEELRARAGDKVSVRLALTRGRTRKLKAEIEGGEE